MQLTAVEWLVGLLLNAEMHGLTVNDLLAVVGSARTMQEADAAVNMLATAMDFQDARDDRAA